MNNSNLVWQARTALLIGENNVERLSHAHILQVGVGGVGAYTAEQLCRAGIGEMTLVDADSVSLTNLNRQLPALHSSIGQNKVDVLSARFKDINPQIKIHSYPEFIHDERTTEILAAAPYDYVVDAIDSLSPKVYLIYHALQAHLPIVSIMGAGGKTDPTKIQIADISETSYCHLAKAIRKRLSKLGIKEGVKAVFSTEEVPANAICIDEEDNPNKLSTVGTISYMPAAFGCFAAAAVIRDLIRINE